jgi:hypothetical protein
MLSWAYAPLIVGGLGRHVDALAWTQAFEHTFPTFAGTRFTPDDPSVLATSVARLRIVGREYSWAAVAKRTAALYAAYEGDERVRITRAGTPTATP